MGFQTYEKNKKSNYLLKASLITSCSLLTASVVAIPITYYYGNNTDQNAPIPPIDDSIKFEWRTMKEQSNGVIGYISGLDENKQYTIDNWDHNGQQNMYHGIQELRNKNTEIHGTSGSGPLGFDTGNYFMEYVISDSSGTPVFSFSSTTVCAYSPTQTFSTEFLERINSETKTLIGHTVGTDWTDTDYPSDSITFFDENNHPSNLFTLTTDVYDVSSGQRNIYAQFKYPFTKKIKGSISLESNGSPQSWSYITDIITFGK